MPSREPCFMTASELVQSIQARKLSCKEVMEAHVAQIERVNPKVNAIVTFVPEQALQQARQADEALARGEKTGPLHGLPVAHKDLTDTKGLRTTYGSAIFKDHVPAENALCITRIQQAGGITVGKTNTAEFGAGSHTFNQVFGTTLNPWDTTKTSGGSSGGAAAALACGMVPLADGSDLGGSLRNPANFCNLVGFRPSPGRVPGWPSIAGWFTLSVQGPMARTVQDTALLLSVMAGYDRRSPIAIDQPGGMFAQPLDRDFRGVRIGWLQDLGGLPFDHRVKTVVDGQRKLFESLGCVVEDGEPDFSGADEAFRTWRAWYYQLAFGKLLKPYRHLIKATVIEEIENGARLTGERIAQAEAKRTALYHRVRAFMETHEFMVLPVNQVPPFDTDREYVSEIEGVKLARYTDWMRSAYYISSIGLPAISVPAGFTPEGLPVGIQIVGRHHDDFGVLQLAYAFEKTAQAGNQKPPVAD
ncbi:MAG: amidase [Acidobacteria bacterium]|nr:amidase [Acidobacteriota bacterium]